MQISSSLSCLVLTASVLLHGAAFAESEPAPIHLTSEEVPSLRDLQQLQYEPSSSASMPTGIPSYSGLVNIARSFANYRRGLELLANYQEPTASRSRDGIAVFTKTAEAVVAVVAADRPDDQITYRGFGTGVIIDSSGLVVTNWHVVQGFNWALIFLKPPSSGAREKVPGYTAEVIAASPTADLALLRFLSPPTTLPVVRIADVDDVQVSQDIHVIGHPQGEVWSYTTGVVRQIRRNYFWQ